VTRGQKVGKRNWISYRYCLIMKFRHVQRDGMDISTELYDGGYPIMNYHLGIVTVPVMVVGTRQSADEDFCMGRPYLSGLAGWDIEPVMFVLGHFLTKPNINDVSTCPFSLSHHHFISLSIPASCWTKSWRRRKHTATYGAAAKFGDAYIDLSIHLIDTYTSKVNAALPLNSNPMPRDDRTRNPPNTSNNAI